MDVVVIAKVALAAAAYAIDKPYDYLVPAELEGRAIPGVRVLVPFGRGNKHTEGIVLALSDTVPSGKRLKEVYTVLDDAPVLDEQGLKLCLWMRERYFCTVYDAARAMLPAGLWFSIRDTYQIAPGVDREASYAAAGRSRRAEQILDLLWACGGAAELGQIHAALGTADPAPALKILTEHGVLRLETSAQRGVGDKREKVAALALPAEDAMASVSSKRRSAPLRYAVVELLCAVGSTSVKELCYFTGASNATIRSLVKSGLVTLKEREVFRGGHEEATGPVPSLPPAATCLWRVAPASDRPTARPPSPALPIPPRKRSSRASSRPGKAMTPNAGSFVRPCSTYHISGQRRHHAPVRGGGAGDAAVHDARHRGHIRQRQFAPRDRARCLFGARRGEGIRDARPARAKT